MKHSFLAACCCLGWTFQAPAQSVTAAIDQLAALQTFAKMVEQGYRTITTGLNTIGTVRAAEYRLHQNCIDRLDTVQPFITTDEKTAALLIRLTQLIATLQSTRDYWQNQPTQ